ncbi:glycosyltransferase family 2 protein [Pseudoxanthomonas putridarboris]|uniref:Glycosyltransferase family 2 protein n=1 Tax=Pseudoxanthomonas putridarboris TaxID=752605 RepID=A0ABU9IYD0_9GAMM
MKRVPGRVSVVMPAYNAAETLEASMQSVLGQSHADVELLVVDDGSRDRSREIVEEVSRRDRRVTGIALTANGGVSTARNTGIEAASGEYVAFLDSDDRWHPDKLRIQLEAMRGAGAQVGYTAYQRVDGDDRVLSTVHPPASVDYAGMLKGNCIGNLTGLYARALGEVRFPRAGHEDYVFWLRVVRLAGKAVCTDPLDPLAYYLVRPGSLSANKWRAARWQWRIYRDFEGIGVLPASWYFVNYAANAVMKRM